MGALRSCTTNSRVRNDGTTYAMKVAAKMAEQHLERLLTKQEKMTEGKGWGMMGWTVAGGVLWLLVGFCCSQR